jgi:hypothetical protein
MPPRDISLCPCFAPGLKPLANLRAASRAGFSHAVKGAEAKCPSGLSVPDAQDLHFVPL